MARECSWVTPHLSYQSTHELHLYVLVGRVPLVPYFPYQTSSKSGR